MKDKSNKSFISLKISAASLKQKIFYICHNRVHMHHISTFNRQKKCISFVLNGHDLDRNRYKCSDHASANYVSKVYFVLFQNEGMLVSNGRVKIYKLYRKLKLRFQIRYESTNRDFKMQQTSFFSLQINNSRQGKLLLVIGKKMKKRRINGHHDKECWV